MTTETRIQKLGLELPDTPPPAGIYKNVCVVNNTVFVAGQGPLKTDGRWITGKVGTDLTIEEAVSAARIVGLTMLATLQQELGSLNRINKFVKVLGMVNCTPDFKRHPQVIDGFSQLIVDIWGESGKAARSAVGMSSLPGNIPVEIEAILQLND